MYCYVSFYCFGAANIKLVMMKRVVAKYKIIFYANFLLLKFWNEIFKYCNKFSFFYDYQ